MSPDESTLRKLEKLAEQLNASTDELNRVIESLESRLARMSLGITVWLVNAWLDRPYVDELDKTEAVILGYAKTKDGWRICAATAHLRWFHDGNEYDIVDLSEPTPLTLRSREIRIAACDCLDDLLGRMADLARHRLEGIERAKAVAADRREAEIKVWDKYHRSSK